MLQINYRTAKTSDLEYLYEFEQGIISAERPFDPTLKEGKINYYDLKKMIQQDDVEIILAVLGEEIIGSGYVKIIKAKPYLKFESLAYIGFIYVKPDHRRKGISQTIIKKLIQWAKSKGMNEVRLNVYHDNDQAVRAYEKIGMKKHLIEMRMEI